MKLNYILEKNDYDFLHDVCLDVFKISLSTKELSKVFEELPRNIKDTAFCFGCSDTVFKDNMCEYLENNYDECLDNIRNYFL